MRMPQYRRCFTAITVMLLGCSLVDRAHAVGSDAGAISLTFGPSTRSEAMGGVYATEANDYAARWSNPGGLAFVDHNIIGTMFSQLVPSLASDVYFMYGGYVHPTKSIGTLQVDLTYLSYGESQAVSDDQRDLGTFRSYEISPAAGLGFKFLPNLGVGVAVKWVRIDLAPESVLSDPQGSGSGAGNSWAFDLGALYNADRLRFGGVISNLGPDITFIDNEQSDPMPRALRLGAMYDVVRSDVSQVRFGAEYEQSLVRLSRNPVYHAGAEFVYMNTFALRAGYLNDEEGAVKGFSGGFGFTWGKASLEYANVPQAESLDRPHRFALWVRY